ncbi:hypothetical protein GQF42_42950 [Streptomyces broussonetiae]|uniref:Uncharacterized protein n=2 Tax=Streptomyces broussonetiae TaxID=2686304 RepID=A0A6I6NJF2_9ACTN|nr:hypothetical protein [Streptomyces broussonetiae]QHA09085.1 hypothetical protein GQF42_42950 [Streptomyces broussonetiae]
MAILPPLWTRLPLTDRVGVAALVLVVAFVALIVGTRVRQALVRPFRRCPGGQAVEPVDTSWFAAHTLDGFPEEAVRAALKASDTPSLDRLYAAWVLANHTCGMSAMWLERNLDLPADVAHLIVAASEEKRRAAEESPSLSGHDHGRRAVGTGTPPAGQTRGH